MMLNNEFAYSTRGTETPDKSYTFRAHPDRVGILKEMGVDIVSLANNHALDFGPDALVDTFDTLDGAGVDYVGAGNNLDRAKAPIYYTVGDKKIAYVAASRVVFAMDWYASETGLGMIGTYDPTLILESIEEVEANSDFVVIFVHWGVERENYPVDYQRTMAKQYIDAGADAVVGCHPHVLQGIEYYKGKPIAYSLGNFWFNKSTKESALLKLYLDPDDTVRVQLLPAMNKDTYTYLLTEENERKAYYDFMEEISFDVAIDKEGYITEVR
jgi:poly-gamma-glutamate synthesis protein (capsule biosynthesis protein)